jgi:predicted NBD/HSP70 family sugar kinase
MLSGQESDFFGRRWNVRCARLHVITEALLMGESAILVLEVGGTTLRAALFAPGSHALTNRRSALTPNHLDRVDEPDLQGDVLAELSLLATGVLDGALPRLVAIAYPGPIDEKGRVLAAPTVLGRPAGEPFDLQGAAQELWPSARVTVLNDVTAAGYRYVASGLRDFAIITVGSGIGHKVFLEGVPRVGPGGRGGEIGHLRLDYGPAAPACECGAQGHLGALASGRGTVANVRRRAEAEPAAFAASALSLLVGSPAEVDGPHVAEAYQAGDPLVVAAVAESVRYMGQGLAAIHLDTGVESFLLVGGFALAMGETYRRQVAISARDASWNVGHDWDRGVRLGELDDDSALLGSGLLLTGIVGP